MSSYTCSYSLMGSGTLIILGSLISFATQSYKKKSFPSEVIQPDVIISGADLENPFIHKETKVQANSEIVSNWSACYPNYAAYTITASAAPEIFQEKILASKEYFFRTKGRVELERGAYVVRVDLPQLTEKERAQLKKLESLIVNELLSEERQMAMGPITECYDYLSLGVYVYKTFNPTVTWDEGSDEITKSRKPRFLAYSNKPEASLKRFWDYIRKLSAQKMTRCEYLMIAYDQSKLENERFDTYLSTYFLKICKKYDLKSYYDPEEPLEKRRLYVELNNSLVQARQLVFGVTSLASEIGTVQNKIDWNNGKIIVVCGNPESFIGYVRGAITYMLNPWQNQGKFFRLKLNQPGVLVMCPKSYRKIVQVVDPEIKIAYFEDMSPDQLKYFNVPPEYLNH